MLGVRAAKRRGQRRGQPLCVCDTFTPEYFEKGESGGGKAKEICNYPQDMVVLGRSLAVIGVVGVDSVVKKLLQSLARRITQGQLCAFPNSGLLALKAL